MTAGINGRPRQGEASGHIVLWLLAVAGVASGTLLLTLGSDLSFFLDDWEFLLYRPGWTSDSILRPHGEHISIAPIVIYKLLQSSFGMGSAMPFRVTATGLFLVSAVLLFVWMRRRAGDWPALIGTVLILFLGAAWEDLLWPFQMGYFGSMAAGLGMLAALGRRDRTGDSLACALLTVSVIFSSLGLPFAAGAAVDVWLRRRQWRERLFVVAIPLAIYAGWWLGWGHSAENAVSLRNLVATPRFLFESVGEGISSLTGLSTPSVRSRLGFNPSYLLAAGALLLAAWRLLRLLPNRVPNWFWVVAAIALAFWFLAGLNEKPGRAPAASRYQYVNGILILLITAELLRGVRIRWRALAAASVIAAMAVASNAKYLHDAYLSYKSITDLERADLAAVEIASPTVPPLFVLEEDIADTAYVHVHAGVYLTAADKYGSPAYSHAELAEAPEPAQVAADKVLAAALGLTLLPLSPERSSSHSARDPNGPTDVSLWRKGGCLTIPASGVRSRIIPLFPGRLTVRPAASASVGLRLGRISSSFPVKLRWPRARGATLIIPLDRLRRPWKLLVNASKPTVICKRIGS